VDASWAIDAPSAGPVEIRAPLGQGRGGAKEGAAMVAGIVLLLGLMLLATQLMLQGSTGEWPSITLASKLGIPADRVFSDWMVLDKPIHFILHDVQLSIVLIFAAALIYWVTDWTAEQLNRLSRRPPAGPQEPELADSGKSV
jgi:hypothetical protein